MQSRALEQKIMDHILWTTICKQQEDGSCHYPASFATVLYATQIKAGENEPLYTLANKCGPGFFLPFHLMTCCAFLQI
jgi:hypothetical protein